MIHAGLNTSGEVDVRNVHTLYVHSNALSNFSALGPKGSRSVIARIPVLGLSGSVLFKQHSGNLHDIIDCSGKMLRVLDFSVRNSHNQLVDLHASAVMRLSRAVLDTALAASSCASAGRWAATSSCC